MLRVAKEGKTKYQSLGISVNRKHWNFKKNELKPQFPNFEQIQKIIVDKKVETDAMNRLLIKVMKLNMTKN